MFLLIKTNARILDLRPVSDFPPCSSGRIPIQGDDKEHLDKHVGFDRWKCDIIHMGLLLVRPRITVFMAVVQNLHIIPVTFHHEGLSEGIYPVQPVHDNQKYRPADSRIHGHAARAETFFKQ